MKKSKSRPQQFLKRKVDKKQDEFIVCAFDMETRGLGGSFIVCAFMAEDGKTHLSYTLQDCLQFIIDNPHYRYLAHNASGYEFAYLYPVLVEHFNSNIDINIVPTIQGDSRIVQFRIEKEGKIWIDLRDTLCLFNASLSSVANSFCPELPKGEPEWNDAHDNFDTSSESWMDYLWRDCEIILVAYRKHATNIWSLFHANLGVTAGSTAMKAFKTTIPEKHIYPRLNKKVENFMREGYYGAAVFPGHQVGDWGKTVGVDVNGAYGFQMGSHEFPVRAAGETSVYEPGMLGMYRVIAHVPASVYVSIGFNPIPCRTKTGLVWKSGTFETVISHIEIEYGLKVGCTFDIIIGYVWFKGEPVFKPFIDKCQELELRDEGIYKASTKLLRNCCYGKFGSKPEHTTIVFSHTIPDDESLNLVVNELTGEIIDNIYTGTTTSETEYMMPHWAAFITAYERIYLFEIMEEAYRRGARNLYCDTDSIKGDANIILGMVQDGTIPVGKLYGQFKVEEICEKFLLVGPKTYYGVDDKGREIKKAKGVPKHLLKKKVYEDAINDNRKQMQFDAVQGVIRLIKQNGGPLPLRRKRTLTDIRNSSAWEINEHGEIYPFGYHEYTQLMVA